MAERPLDGKAALVTGASSGIGNAAAWLLARDGASVAVAARREDRLRELADRIEDAGGEALVVPTDVSDEGQVEGLFSRTVEEFGKLDVAVVNAATARLGPIEDLSTERYRTVIDVNIDGTFFTTRAAIPRLRETEGNLIYVGSFAGKFPRPGDPLYASTKFWMRGFANSLAGQIGGDGIGVTLVNPTEVRTEFRSEDEESAPATERFEAGEVAEPEDVAEAIVFAARQEAPNTTQEIDFFRRDKFEHF